MIIQNIYAFFNYIKEQIFGKTYIPVPGDEEVVLFDNGVMYNRL